MGDRESTGRQIDVWLVEDLSSYRHTVAQIITGAPDMVCSLATATCEEAVEVLEAGLEPDIVLLDIKLPGMNGIEGVKEIKRLSSGASIIMLTVFEENTQILAAVCAGATGYLLKSSTTAEEIREAVRLVHRGGAMMSPYIARKMLKMFAKLKPPQPSQADYGLSTREKEILLLLVDGLTMRQVANRLTCSYHTVDSHVRHIYEKLHVHTRSGAVAKALKERLV